MAWRCTLRCKAPSQKNSCGTKPQAARERILARVLSRGPLLGSGGVAHHLLQHLQVAAQVAVGEGTQLLEVTEGQPARVDHERGKQAEPRLLVDGAVEPRVGERRLSLRIRHRRLQRRNGGWRPAAAGRSRTAGPWPTATAPASGSTAPAPPRRRPRTTCRPTPPRAAAIAPRRRCRGPPAPATGRAAPTASRARAG